MDTFPWLTLLGLLPIVGSLLPFLLKGRIGQWAALTVAVVTLALAVAVTVLYARQGGDQFTQVASWIPAFGAYWAVGLDGLALSMVLLTVVLTPIVLLADWRRTETGGTWGGSTWAALILLVEGLALFVFVAQDVLLFYLFFEATLIPMYFLIAGWGGERRRRAAVKFLLFSLAGGLVMLASVIGLYVVSADQRMPTMLIADLANMDLSGGTGRWLMVGFLIAFVVKAPMVPLHTWLPDTTAEATPGTSTMLVGVLDKIGTFGMIRFCLELFPEASRWATPVMVTLALVSILYGAIVAIGQKNLLRLVAFTSISHFGFMVLGIYAWTTVSLSGTMFYMLMHGFSTAAMFLTVGFLVDRRGSADIAAFGGVQKVAPVLAGVLLVSGLSALSLPGLGSFVGEFLVLAGAFSRYPVYAAIAALGVILAAVYILVMYQRTMTGPVTEQVDKHITSDLSTSERWLMVPVLGVLLLFGFWPQPALDLVQPTAEHAMTAAGVDDPAPQVGKEG